MSKPKLLIDSTIDIPEEWYEKYDIGSIPLHIIIDDEVYDDGVNIKPEDVAKAIDEGKIPKTSQVSGAAAEKIYRKYLDEGRDLIVFSFSDKLSGTYKNLLATAKELEEEYPDQKIEVIDTEGAAFGVGLNVKKIAEMPEDTPFEELVDTAKERIAATNYLFTIPSLEWLVKGGRINKAVGTIGDMMQIKPILTLDDGLISVKKKVRGQKKAEKYLMDELLKNIKDHPDQILGIGHSSDPEVAERLKQQILDVYPDADIVIIPIGSVLTTHLGKGGVGVFWVDKEYLDKEAQEEA